MSDRIGAESCTGAGEIVTPLASCLYGRRAFRIVTDGRLQSVATDYIWRTGTNTAYCLLARRTLPHNGWSIRLGYTFDVDGIPHLNGGYEYAPCPGVAKGDHGCGFYGIHAAPDHYSGWAAPWEGVVAMWGDIELGPAGMRSSRAAIVALTMTNHLYVESLTSGHYPDIPVYPTVTAMLETHPLSDVSGLLQ